MNDMAIPNQRQPAETVDAQAGAGVPSATTQTTTREPTVNLSIYDHTKGCFILNPENFTPVINAFHPDYIKTYHPEFLTAIRTENTQKTSGAIGGAKTKAARESVNKGAFTISRFPKTKAADRAALAPKDFHVFTKAGSPKKAKK